MKPTDLAHLAIFSSVLNGASSDTYCAMKIAGPLMVRIVYVVGTTCFGNGRGEMSIDGFQSLKAKERLKVDGDVGAGRCSASEKRKVSFA